MAQHGQVLTLRARRADGKPLWAYRYRVNGRCSRRPQVGGFATRAEAERALRRTLERLRPGGTMTLAELVEGYLEVHQAAPATIEKLRWLLAKATLAFGEVRLVDLRAEEICAWRGTLPEGHRFEATQALRQVLNRAVAWQLIDVNPAKRGVSNPLRRFPEKRPFESWAEIRAIAARLGPVTGPMVVFAAATGVRPAELAALEQRDVDRAAGVVYVRRQLVRRQIKHTKTRRSMRAVPLQSARAGSARAPTPVGKSSAVSRAARRLPRPAQLPRPRMEAGRARRRNRASPPALRPASHLRHLRSPRRRLDLRPVTVHGRQPGDDRPPLRTPRPRRTRARGCAPRRLRNRDRRVDAWWTPHRQRKPARAERSHTH